VLAPQGEIVSDALIVIDVQHDFCPGGALEVPHGDEVVSLCNELMASVPLVVLTQDWHPPGHTSFASTHGRSPYETVELPYGTQVLWPDHCVQGTRGAAFHDDLLTDRAHLVVRKGWRPSIDSYSALLENDHATPTGLGAALRELGTSRVILCGLATDFCVRYSALDAVRAGFEVAVVEEACRGIDLDGSVAAAWAELASAGIARIHLGDL
jgi:nicotinamidase/pyrazinamidase